MYVRERIPRCFSTLIVKSCTAITFGSSAEVGYETRRFISGLI